MAQPISVLMVEDSEDDAILLANEMRRAGYDATWERVDTAPALRAALGRQPWDAVLIDYVMPKLSALAALEMVREHDPDTPCIIVSGKVTDETAIQVMKAGAQDFIPKDTLARLPPVIERERRAAQARRVAHLNEARLHAIIESAVDGIIIIDDRGVVESLNPAAARMFGYTPEEVVGENVSILMPEPYRSEHPGHIERYLRTGEARIIGTGRDVEARRKDGTTFPIHLSVSETRFGDRRLFTGIIHDITERRRADAERARLYEAAEAARDAAREADAAKDQFVAMVSHELRNPLNAITAGMHLLRQSSQADPRAGRALEIVERNVRLQARLVDDLLDLSRLQRGRLPLQRAPVELGAVTLAACRSAEAEIQDAALTLTCEAEPDLWVHGDEDRIQQVLMNLLTNAHKFTPPPGEITVWASRAGDSARIEVADTGIGISPELLPILFEIFSQGEIAGHRAAGLGLGLALVKGIVERHGGRVCAESQGMGQGSRFIVELPLTTSYVPIPRQIARDPQHSPRILLVEDNADTRVLIADSLTLAGYDVCTAASGEDALGVLGEGGGCGDAETGRYGDAGSRRRGEREDEDAAAGAGSLTHALWQPDVMLVDIGLPGIDGFEFLRRARALPGVADVPAFAVTGYGSQEDVRRGREVGVTAHFVKPVDPRVLDQRIRELLGLPTP